MYNWVLNLYKNYFIWRVLSHYEYYQHLRFMTKIFYFRRLQVQMNVHFLTDRQKASAVFII